MATAIWMRPSLSALCCQLLLPKPSDGEVTLDVGLDGGRLRAHGLTPKRLGSACYFSSSLAVIFTILHHPIGRSVTAASFF